MITDLRNNLENELGDLKKQMQDQQAAFKEQMDRLVDEQRQERIELGKAEREALDSLKKEVERPK